MFVCFCQVCVISGESGAGKTETSKLFVRQVLDLSLRALDPVRNPLDVLRDGSPASSNAGTAMPRGFDHSIGVCHPVEKKILQINPILEAFGNAKTTMNDNSSRFGKLIELQFDKRGLVRGARLSHYLLEKSRVTLQAEGESNFHVFRLLLNGAGPEVLARYSIPPGRHFQIMPSNGSDIDGTAALKRFKLDWAELADSFAVLGIDSTEVEDIVSCLGFVLYTGEMDFISDGHEGSRPQEVGPFELAAGTVILDPELLATRLTEYTITTRGETFTKQRNPPEARTCRDAVAKLVYAKLFGWIVGRLDQLLAPDSAFDGSASDLSVGVLDIFGFEDFKSNSLEQLCINLANEQLQAYFNEHVFKAEIRACEDEGIAATTIDYKFIDNDAILRLFYARPIGLIALVDEESRFPGSTDKSLMEKLASNLQSRTRLQVLGTYAFRVSHFAGQVTYEADGILTKNRDAVPEDVVELLRTSNSMFLSAIMAEVGPPESGVTVTPRTGQHRVSRLAKLSKRIFGGKSSRAASKPTASRRRSRRSTPTSGGNGPKRQQYTVTSVTAAEPTAPRRGTLMNTGGTGVARRSTMQSSATVIGGFKSSLDRLMRRFGQCSPHFIRCIKPNVDRRPGLYDAEYVHDQLRYTGMLETTRIRKDGFAHRLPFGEFFRRYRGLVYTFTDDPERYRKTNDWRFNMSAQVRRARATPAPKPQFCVLYLPINGLVTFIFPETGVFLLCILVRSTVSPGIAECAAAPACPRAARRCKRPCSRSRGSPSKVRLSSR